ncbi:MAG: c-type cytochrome [Candidatus Marinimicrobia bacterium]|nr:c-type cytochrome [Candidatus Neomarinimicrobiota bacterium]
MLTNKVKDKSTVFAITSLLFLGVLAISPTKDYFSEWRAYQKEFNRLIKDQPRRIKPVEIGIKQIWLPELGVTDRCTSCHVGISNQKLVDIPAPFKPHPIMYHDSEEFGCTPCHNGQGIATTVEESVGHEEFWDSPMLPLPFTEAGCGTCHKEVTVNDAPLLSKGRLLMQELNCVACHILPGFKPEYVPPLDGVGKKRSRDWLVRWLTDPRSVHVTAKMPDFRLNMEEVDILADFLMSFDTYPETVEIIPLPDELKKEWPDDDWVNMGAKHFREARCISCHQINGKGGHLAPEIGKIASEVTHEWLYNYIRNPREFHAGVPMPQYGFSEKQTKTVTAYILSEFQDWDIEEDSIEAVHTPVPGFYQKGLELFNHYNCMGCHELNVQGIGRNMGPVLTNIGSKPQPELEFGDVDIVHTRTAYIYEKIKNPHQFLENSRMPIFDLEEEELKAITVALLSMNDKKIPSNYLPPESAISTYEPQGMFGQLVDKYSCFSCHVINGKGYLLASDLTLEGSRVHLDWMKHYFEIPYTLRPTLTERMPNLFLQESEIEYLSDYISTVFVNDEIDEVEIKMNEEVVQRGKKLVNDIYGCVSCHQVDGKGGYVGPPFNETGKRSKPGWIYNWIKNPQKYRPDTIDPNAGLTDEEAKQITAYILNLK